MPKLTTVPVPCLNGHHDSHTVSLAPMIDLAGAIEAERTIFEVGQTGTDQAYLTRELTYRWAPIFIRHGAKDWDLCDEDGNPAPFDVEAIVADYRLARPVAEAANELGYGSEVLAPFLSQLRKQSPTTRTTATTSPPTTPTPRRRGSR